MNNETAFLNAGKMLIYDCKIPNMYIKRAYLEARRDSNLGNYFENRLPQDIKRIFNVFKI